MKISICIPTYNRATHLTNCLNSIVLNNAGSDINYELCISDNCSTDNTGDVVKQYTSLLPINYYKNTENIGMSRNFLNVVEMAKGDFIWLLGDDDLLLPDALETLSNLIQSNSDVDYFYINSYHLSAEFVMSHSQPFDTANLPDNMTSFSSWSNNGKCSFLELINPKISFDYLGGIFLSVFRRNLWVSNVTALSQSALFDKRTFSHFDNTFPHVKIFSQAFAGKNAYFNAKPLSVCLTGVREWAPLYFLIRSVRLPEALKEYRDNGLEYFRYLYCKNTILKYFIPDLVYMLINYKTSGLKYINVRKHILANCLYPNVYLSFVYYFGRRIRNFLM